MNQHPSGAFAAIYEASRIAIAICDANGTIVDANTAFSEMLGYARGELNGKSYTEITHPEDLLAEQDPLKSLNAGTIPFYRCNKRYLMLDGTAVSAQVMTSVVQETSGQWLLRVVEGGFPDSENDSKAASLLREIVSLQQQERKKLARELHDEAGQSLTGLLIGLRSIMNARKLADARATASALRDVTATTLENLSRLARGLHPNILDDMGLEAAIDHFVAEFASRYAIQVESHTTGLPASNLCNEAQLTIFRIFQEALTNVVKHSGASRVNVELVIENPLVRMSISDNGKGFNPNEKRDWNHLGLSGMKERAFLLHGELQIHSGPGQGTSLIVQFPYHLATVNQAENLRGVSYAR